MENKRIIIKKEDVTFFGNTFKDFIELNINDVSCYMKDEFLRITEKDNIEKILVSVNLKYILRVKIQKEYTLDESCNKLLDIVKNVLKANDPNLEIIFALMRF